MTRYAPLFVIIGAALWGVDGILLRPSLYTLPVALVVLVESCLIVLLLSPYMLSRLNDLKVLTRRDWLILFCIALVGGVIGTMSITKALFYVHFVKLSVVVLLQKLQPVFAIFLAAMLLRERPARIFYLWAALAIAGAYIMTFGWQIPDFAVSPETAAAAFFAVIAAIAFASGTVLGKMALRTVSHQAGAYMRFVFTAIIMAVVAGFLGDIKHLPDISAAQWGIFLAIALGSGVIAMLIYYYGLKRVSAAVATICELAFPLTAVVLDYMRYDNALSKEQWVGVAILLFSMLQVSLLRGGQSSTGNVSGDAAAL